jgi:hypothetical protein
MVSYPPFWLELHVEEFSTNSADVESELEKSTQARRR